MFSVSTVSLKAPSAASILLPARNQTKTGPNKEVNDGTVSARPSLVDELFVRREAGQTIH
jgi:hypothetical protein